MKRNNRHGLGLGLFIVVICVSACGRPPAPSAEEAIKIEEQGSGLKTLTLTAKSAERLGIQTASVEDRGSEIVVPYASVIYDADGGTWAYVAVQPLTFERAAIVIESIDGEEALLADGPPTGTPVVIVGAAELYGAETGVGGGH